MGQKFGRLYPDDIYVMYSEEFPPPGTGARISDVQKQKKKKWKWSKSGATAKVKPLDADAGLALDLETKLVEAWIWDPWWLWNIPYVTGMIIDACRNEVDGSWIYTVEKTKKPLNVICADERYLRLLSDPFIIDSVKAEQVKQQNKLDRKNWELEAKQNKGKKQNQSRFSIVNAFGNMRKSRWDWKEAKRKKAWQKVQQLLSQKTRTVGIRCQEIPHWVFKAEILEKVEITPEMKLAMGMDQMEAGQSMWGGSGKLTMVVKKTTSQGILQHEPRSPVARRDSDIRRLARGLSPQKHMKLATKFKPPKQNWDDDQFSTSESDISDLDPMLGFGNKSTSAGSKSKSWSSSPIKLKQQNSFSQQQIQSQQGARGRSSSQSSQQVGNLNWNNNKRHRSKDSWKQWYDAGSSTRWGSWPAKMRSSTRKEARLHRRTPAIKGQWLWIWSWGSWGSSSPFAAGVVEKGKQGSRGRGSNSVNSPPRVGTQWIWISPVKWKITNIRPPSITIDKNEFQLNGSPRRGKHSRRKFQYVVLFHADKTTMTVDAAQICEFKQDEVTDFNNAESLNMLVASYEDSDEEDEDGGDGSGKGSPSNSRRRSSFGSNRGSVTSWSRRKSSLTNWSAVGKNQKDNKSQQNQDMKKNKNKIQVQKLFYFDCFSPYSVPSDIRSSLDKLRQEKITEQKASKYPMKDRLKDRWEDLQTSRRQDEKFVPLRGPFGPGMMDNEGYPGNPDPEKDFGSGEVYLDVF